MASPRWWRPRHRADPARLARVELIALLSGPRIEGALERARAEVGDAAIFDQLEVEVRAAATDGGRLDEALGGRAAHALALRDEHERRDVASCRRYATIVAAVADPPSLDLLQASTALLRALALEDDLVLALDASTARWWSPPELAALDPARPFALDEHCQVVVEAVERTPGAGHVVRSRGLVKLARPDVAARVPRRDAERVAEVVRDLARLLAEGELVRPGDRLALAELPSLTMVPLGDDCRAAPPDTAPLYELRDLATDGGAARDCAALVAALRPRPRLKVLH
jgi:hypothetical protein